MTRVQRRRAVNALALVLSSLAAVVGLFFLLWILVVIFQKGGAAINWAFLTDLPTPPGVPGGGMANAITGTLIITLLATLGGVPLGLLAGIYLSEFGRGERLGKVIRFLADTFMSAPSIVIGIFVYAILVVPMGGFSGLAGGVSLALIMLPVVTRTSEEMLKLVPQEMREASLALGAPYWHMVLHVALRGAKVGLITGVLLAVARVSGETAPLLFTTLNSPYWPSGLTDPMANLTVTIFNYAMSPYEDWQTQAWGAALLLATGVLGLNITARLLFRDRRRTS
ncbi:MAG: phosphate ABC transporter, permease protein PstA [Alphaproteobacteria bacterium CG_4_10_14_0_2_um_filter_63_37]|nr:MAG: phosphate ABC transporter, permease protein PstA [Proteobacteria bacterium CG1_02_64_396]PJA23674.1 MAG: phosphate ABC transporter, permease protein PstA [Alphaproteobacteria bacterium CG_4_10_14_0_2_um_filter_63_37]